MKELYVLPGQDCGASLNGRPSTIKEVARFESDASYFQRRAAEERAFAATIEDSRARSLHLDLAERFDNLAGEIARTTL